MPSRGFWLGHDNESDLSERVNDSKATPLTQSKRGKHVGIAVLDQSDGLILPALVLTTCAVDIPEKKCQKSAKDGRIAITPR